MVDLEIQMTLVNPILFWFHVRLVGLEVWHSRLELVVAHASDNTTQADQVLGDRIRALVPGNIFPASRSRVAMRCFGKSFFDACGYVGCKMKRRAKSRLDRGTMRPGSQEIQE
jgi:hypothetical protein